VGRASATPWASADVGQWQPTLGFDPNMMVLPPQAASATSRHRRRGRSPAAGGRAGGCQVAMADGSVFASSPRQSPRHLGSPPRPGRRRHPGSTGTTDQPFDPEPSRPARSTPGVIRASCEVPTESLTLLNRIGSWPRYRDPSCWAAPSACSRVAAEIHHRLCPGRSEAAPARDPVTAGDA